MRLWTVPPATMCQKHLLGEHVETHMMAASSAKGHSLEGFYRKGLIDTDRIESRHTKLANEMLARGIKHISALISFDNPHLGHLTLAATGDLHARCPECRERYKRLEREAMDKLFRKECK